MKREPMPETILAYAIRRADDRILRETDPRIRARLDAERASLIEQLAAELRRHAARRREARHDP